MKCFLLSAKPLFKTQCDKICCCNNRDTFNTLFKNNVCGSCDCETIVNTDKINNNKTNIKENAPKISIRIPNVSTIDLENESISTNKNNKSKNLCKKHKSKNKNSSAKLSHPIDLNTYH